MANLLLTAANWKDGNNASPPAEWSGTAYAFTAADTVTLTATAAAGDTLTGTFVGTEQNQGHQIAINVNGSDAITWSGPGSSVLSFPESIAIALAAGDTVAIVTQNDACGFVPDFTLTPTADPAPPAATCDELGRVTREYVSAYQRGRVHQSNLVRGETRCLIADFNGVIVGHTIASVQWYCLQPYAVAMSNAQITDDGKQTMVMIAAQSQGQSILKCVVTLDNGEQYTQMFRVLVRGFPWFVGESVPPMGPWQLSAVAA